MVERANGGNVLVAVDGSVGSRRALRWADRFAAEQGMALGAVQAWSYPPLAGLLATDPLPGPAEVDEQVQAALEQVLADELGPDHRAARVFAVHGEAPGALLAAAEGASVLVTGRQGLGGVAGWLGSVSRALLEQASCPVVVVPPEWEPGDEGDVVVGVDFSEGSRAAVRWAASVARATGHRLVALHALAPTATDAVPGPGAQAEAELELGELLEPETSGGLRGAAVVSTAVPPTALDDAAAEDATGLVVVGRRGTGLARKLLLGSVAGYVARHAPSPVAVVPLEG